MSSSDFASDIFQLNQNFNIIALNLPGSHYLDLPKQTLSIDYFNQIVDYFINHHLKKYEQIYVDTLFELISNGLNLFELNSELFIKALDKMKKNDYIELSDNKVKKIDY